MKRADLVAIGPGECPIARKIAIVLGAPRIVNALFGEAERLGQDHFHRLGEELNDYVRWSRPSTLFSLHGLRMSEVANGTMDIAPTRRAAIRAGSRLSKANACALTA